MCSVKVKSNISGLPVFSASLKCRGQVCVIELTIMLRMIANTVRKPRIHIPGGLYHVMLRGNGGQDIFFSPEDH